ncbi:hypothetical protein [Nocardia sp. NBC_01327]|uniref:hypothetical protein n=1 Tax=Nocardia sp. NBC_01327 TaxID=2903593 RepID=UPI002E1005B4|nr:hypothetical protein OG326_28245 [Nocardia sp. NBC_01327]
MSASNFLVREKAIMSETEENTEVVVLVKDSVKANEPETADAAPVVTDAAPVVTDAAPVVTDAAPVVTDAAPAMIATAPVVSEPPVDPKPLRLRGLRTRAYPIAVAAAALFAVVAVVMGVFWHNSTGDLDALRTSDSDRARAAEVASDYTVRSLNYDYKNLPAFFDGVQRGTSDALRNKYTQVHDTLSKIMTGAQVVATGKVVGSSVEAKGNDQYAVTVYATQRTQNIQQTDPATVPNLLLVTVAKSGGDWVVVDYGPKDGDAKDGGAKDGAAK